MSAVAHGLSRRSDTVPGDALLHPVALLAIGLLIVNDHLLKQLAPGLLTGKLSDFAGLAFFPLAVQAAWEVGSATLGRPSLGSRRVLVVATVASGLVFAAIQLVPAAGDAYRSALGFAQWLVGSIPAMLVGRPAGTPWVVDLTADPTDLAALPALAVPYLIGRARAAGIVRCAPTPQPPAGAEAS